MRNFFLSILIFCSLAAGAQETARLEGKVLDERNMQPLPFAQLTVAGTTLGTTTNEEGVFVLNVPAGADTLLVAYMGFDMRRIPVGRGRTFEVLMHPALLMLKEVEIVAYTPQEVLRRTVRGIPSNYGNKPVILSAYVRVSKITGNHLAEFAEAIVEDRKDGYYLYPPGKAAEKHDRSNVPLLVKGRVKSDTALVNSLGDIGRSAFCLGCSFMPDIVEFYHDTPLDEKKFKDYDYGMKELENPAGGKIFLITFDQKDGLNEKGWKGEFYINASDFALLKAVLKPSMKAWEAYEKTKNRKTLTLDNNPGWIQEMPMGETSMTYEKRDSLWSLATLRADYTMIYTQTAIGRKIRYRYKTDLVVTGVERDPVKTGAFKGDKSLGTDQRWDQLLGTPDRDFWEGYNYLPVEEKLGEEIRGLGH